MLDFSINSHHHIILALNVGCAQTARFDAQDPLYQCDKKCNSHRSDQYLLQIRKAMVPFRASMVKELYGMLLYGYE